MIRAKTSVCLCMIVKDEAPVIRRCLTSVRPILDHWIVVDTGSTDGTQALVREAMAGLPGELVERPWVDFAHNRSEALALARPHADYALIIDADDEMLLPPGFVLPTLEADCYTVDIHYGASTYRRPQLVCSAIPWRYRGVLHEFLDPLSRTEGHLPIVMRIHHEGARSTNTQTYARDAAILERALVDENDPFLVARYTFYLAQSYRDCGESTKAADAYLRRAEMGYWTEEVYVSLYQAGRMMQATGRDPDAVLAIYARACATAPSRAEAAHAAANMCRSLLRYAEGCAVAEPALGLPAPPDGLFVEPWIYEYALADEFAVNAYWCGRYRSCLDACLRILEVDKVPAAERPRILANMRFALDKLPTEPVLAPIAPEWVGATATAPASPKAPMPLPVTLHLGSGKDFRAEWLNIDIDATWNPDAVLDLSAAALNPEGIRVETDRFGPATLLPGAFRKIVANDVLEHVPNLVGLMTTCLSLLDVGGVFEILVPYDLAFGAWQDPTHVRTFNERSWLYYTDWFWYLGWREARFIVDTMEHVESPLGAQLREAGRPWDEVVRTPRAIDAMRVRLRKIALTGADRETLAHWRDRKIEVANRAAQAPTDIGAPPTNGVASRGGEPRSDEPPAALSEPWVAARDRYCIYVVSPADYAHTEALHDAAGAMSAAFAALGGSAPLVTHPSAWQGRTPIVFGGHLLTSVTIAELSPDAVLFNLEPIDAGSPWTSADYLARLKRHPLLDYSQRNSRALATAGLGHVRHLAIRAMPLPEPACARGNVNEPDIDILFYGSINPRRRAVLDALLARGLKVVELFGVYGAERDAAIARAKVVLNVHYYEAAIFEAVRVCPLLARGACVVSEGQADDPDIADIADGLVLAPLAAIVDRCCTLVADEDERMALSRRARAAITARSQADILRAFFPDAPEPGVTAPGRHDAFLPELSVGRTCDA